MQAGKKICQLIADICRRPCRAEQP